MSVTVYDGSVACSNERRELYAMQYRLRTLLVVLALVATTCAITAWWTRPFVVHKEWDNGRVAEERWQRRTLAGELKDIVVIRYHPNGQKAQEFRGDDVRYWLPDGEEVSAARFFELVP